MSSISKVEIDSTFYGKPRYSTVERWREVASEGFLFAAKFPQPVQAENVLECVCASRRRSLGRLRPPRPTQSLRRRRSS